MQAFEYANPTTVHEAVGMLGARWGEVDVLAGGTDLLSLMKEHISHAAARGEYQEHQGTGRHPQTRHGVHIGATVTFDELERTMPKSGAIIRCWRRRRAGVSSPQIRNMGTVGGDLCQRPRCWYYRNGFGLLGQDKDGKALIPAARINTTPSWATPVRPISSAPPAWVRRWWRWARRSGWSRPPAAAKWKPRSSSSRRKTPTRARSRCCRTNWSTEIVLPSADVHNATYEVRQKEALDWPLATASVVLNMAGDSVSSARIVLGHVAPTPWVAPRRAKRWRAKTFRRPWPRKWAKPRSKAPRRSARIATKCNWRASP